MPLVIAARVSADPGNAASLGSDGNPYAGVPRTWDSAPEYLIDNSWGASGTYYYPLGLSLFAPATSYTGPMAHLQPFMVSRPAKIYAWGVWVTTTQSATYYAATYAAHPVTGLPITKVADLPGVSLNNAGLVQATQNNAVIYQPRTLYYLATYLPGNLGFALVGRSSPNAHPQRVPNTVTPTNLVGAIAQSIYDPTSATWNLITTGPPTLSYSYPTNQAGNGGATPPQVWLGLTNA